MELFLRAVKVNGTAMIKVGPWIGVGKKQEVADA